MTNNTENKNISQLMEAEQIPAVYDNGLVQVAKCPPRDGWYALRMCDKKGIQFDLDYRAHRSGTTLKVWQRLPDRRMILWKTLNLDIQQGLVMNEGRSELQDEVIKYLIEQCPDVQKIFMEFTPQVLVYKGKKRVKVRDRRPGGGGGGDDDGGPCPGPDYTGNGMLELLEFEGRVILVKGYIQSGKTKFMISSAIWFALQGKHSFIVLRNSESDKKQLRSRVKEFNEALQRQMPAHLKGKFVVEAIGNKKLEPSMFAGPPRIFVCIGNATPLRKINRMLGDLSDPRAGKEYVVFVDEVDFVDSLGTQVKTELDVLRHGAFCEFGVSGTVMDTAIEKDILAGNLIMMERPADYFDLASFQRHIIPTESKYGTRKDDDMFIKDPYLATYLEKFATEPLSMANHYSATHDEYHPRYSLLRVTKTHDSNKRTMASIVERYPNMPAGYVYGDGGAMVYIPGQEQAITLADGRISTVATTVYDDRKNDKGEKVPGEQVPGHYHFFTKTEPGFIVQWLYENGGFERFPRYLVLADGMAARSIGFGANNFAWCKEHNKLWWHLTEMYALVSDSMDQAELQQCLGRLCVVKRDSIPLHLWTTHKVSEDLTKAYWASEELIERALAKQRSAHVIKGLNFFLPQVKMYNGKIADRPITKKEHRIIDENGDERPFKVHKVSLAEDRAEMDAWMVEDYVAMDPDTADPISDILEKLPEDMEDEEEEKILLVCQPSGGAALALYNQLKQHLGVGTSWVSISEILDALIPQGARRDGLRGKIGTLANSGVSCQATDKGLQFVMKQEDGGRRVMWHARVM